MSDTALIVIDVQRGMFAFPEQPPFEGDRVLANIYRLVARARDASAPVVFIQHNGDVGHPLEKPGENWLIDPRTGYHDIDLVVEKHNCDAFQDTRLQAVLTNLSASKVVLAGMQTEYCVDTTCRRAFSLGYKVTLASDAHTTYSKPHMAAEAVIEHHNEVLSGSFAEALAVANIKF